MRMLELAGLGIDGFAHASVVARQAVRTRLLIDVRFGTGPGPKVRTKNNNCNCRQDAQDDRMKNQSADTI